MSGGTSIPKPFDGKVSAVATVGMIGDVVKNVGKDHVEVTSLMGPGVDPHLYKPTASDTSKLSNADIIFYGGLELEGRMTDTFVKIARTGKPTIAVSENIDTAKLREPPEFAGKYDPHIWFDVTLWIEVVDTIKKELQQFDPANAKEYEKNAEAYKKELTTLHEDIKKQVATVPQSSRVLVTAHDAFGYFGNQYGFEVKGLQGISTSSEASAKDVQELAQFLVTRKIKAIFVESSVPQDTIKAVQQAARAKGWNVIIGGQLFSDAMGNEGTPEGTYIGMVRHNVNAIVNSLK